MFKRFEYILPKTIPLLVLISLSYSPVFAREFIHIFTSKGIYETCDELWFKCVVFDDSTMHVSDRSHTAYVEIIDSSDSVVWQEKYRMSKGTCDGHAYVGNDWKPGEFRMFVHTKNSLGKNDTVMYPKRLLIVKEFSDIPSFLSSAKESTRHIDLPDSAMASRLNVSVSLDSSEYHTRSKVKATVKVTDANGKPAQAVLAISVTDNLYSYPPSEVDIQSQICGLEHDSFGEREREKERVNSYISWRRSLRTFTVREEEKYRSFGRSVYKCLQRSSGKGSSQYHFHREGGIFRGLTRHRIFFGQRLASQTTCR